MDQLPPLPKSLTNPHISDILSQDGMEATSFSDRLDEQLGCLKREMAGLRQLDLSLLSQLNALRQSIQDYQRVMDETDQYLHFTYERNTNGHIESES